MESVHVSSVAVLDKVMAILDAYERGATVLEPRTVAERTGLTLPTVYRLMQAMTEHSLLEKDGTRFRPGTRLLRLGGLGAAAFDLRRTALPHLNRLSAETAENAELHVRRGHARVAVEVVLSPQNLRPFVEAGMPFPLHVGASAKALLAWLPPDEAEAIADASARHFLGSSAFDQKTFHAALRRTRNRGWADSDGERWAGVAAVAAPVFDVRGEVVAAVVLSGPSTRLPAKRRRELAPLVRTTAASVSKDTGYLESPAQ
ncbi:MAG: helix-turn-helix domain-containing protein [Streptosporangiales bacterium]|nr:helix-turn-helix domain-containing protein [Streptosporangiales bacterium]